MLGGNLNQQDSLENTIQYSFFIDLLKYFNFNINITVKAHFGV